MLGVIFPGSLREEYERTIVPSQILTREASSLEQRISDLVNAAYGLTPSEVELMWQTAPARMPLAPPLANLIGNRPNPVSHSEVR
jgi:hypothetical protein